MKLVKKVTRVVFIGVGGIGTWLLEPLVKTLVYGGESNEPIQLVLIDGDKYEPRNIQRQLIPGYGNKAQVWANLLSHKYTGRLSVRSWDEFVNKDNIRRFIEDGDVVVMCVDNFKTRKLVSDHCRQLKNVALFSGGNDLTDGNSMIFIREKGVDITPPLDKFHKEIATPADKSPDELSCEELARAGTPQLVVTNMAAASSMLCDFYTWAIGKLDRQEVYFDVVLNRNNPINRRSDGAIQKAELELRD